MMSESEVSSDWTLYYNEDGYPYYYNATTGESQWAEFDNATNWNEHQQENENTNQDDEEESDDESDSEESDEDESDEEEDEESQPSESGVQAKITEAMFLKYLKTPEGQALFAAEQAKVEKAIDKKEQKKAGESEKEYVRRLQLAKKHDNNKDSQKAAGSSVFSNLFGFLGAGSSITNTGGAKNTKDSSSSSAAVKQSQSGNYDAHGRETKHRNSTKVKPTTDNNNNTSADDTAFEQVEAGRISAEHTNKKRSDSLGSSNSVSSLSSDAGSVSSDDSDIIAINAPYFSEIPRWLSLETLHAQCIAPTHTYLEENHVYENTSTLLSNVSVTTVNAAQQGFYYTGVGIYSAFSMLFTQVNPLLLAFMRHIIDGNNNNINNNTDNNSNNNNSNGSGSRRNKETITNSTSADNLEGGVANNGDSSSGANHQQDHIPMSIHSAKPHKKSSTSSSGTPRTTSNSVCNTPRPPPPSTPRLPPSVMTTPRQPPLSSQSTIPPLFSATPDTSATSQVAIMTAQSAESSAPVSGGGWKVYSSGSPSPSQVFSTEAAENADVDATTPEENETNNTETIAATDNITTTGNIAGIAAVEHEDNGTDIRNHNDDVEVSLQDISLEEATDQDTSVLSVSPQELNVSLSDLTIDALYSAGTNIDTANEATGVAGTDEAIVMTESPMLKAAASQETEVVTTQQQREDEEPEPVSAEKEIKPEESSVRIAAEELSNTSNTNSDVGSTQDSTQPVTENDPEEPVAESVENGLEVNSEEQPVDYLSLAVNREEGNNEIDDNNNIETAELDTSVTN